MPRVKIEHIIPGTEGLLRYIRIEIAQEASQDFLKQVILSMFEIKEFNPEGFLLFPNTKYGTVITLEIPPDDHTMNEEGNAHQIIENLFQLFLLLNIVFGETSETDLIWRRISFEDFINEQQGEIT